MSRTATEIGMIAGGIAAVLLAPFTGGASIYGYLSIQATLTSVGVAAVMAGTAGLLNPQPNDPSSIAPTGQLPIQTPNPLWRIVYGIFQFAGSITFADGPELNWLGTEGGQPCNKQFVSRIHTLTAHQIAGFLAVVLDGQTYNFGTDLQLLTPANNPTGVLGPNGMWTFMPPPGGSTFDYPNPWAGTIYFEFDCGDPGNPAQPFPTLLAGATFHTFLVGSTRWLPTCLQRGRSKVHVLLEYVPSNNGATWGPLGGGPQPYPLSNGRLPTVEFKIAGRIILDYRVITAWQAEASYPQYSYVLVSAATLGDAGPASFIFVQQNGSGVSGAAAPNFASAALVGETVADGTCLWKNFLIPTYAAGSGQTLLNNPASSKLGGPGGSMLIADAWQGGVGYVLGTVIEAPIGWLQQATTVSGPTGSSRPAFPTALGQQIVDGGTIWTCLGRSKYATCLPDNDGTQNQGGFSNPALVIADYLQTPKNQFGLGAGLTLDSIDSVIAAANICDEPVVIEVFS